MRFSWISCLTAAAAFFIAAARINHGLNDSWLPSGPGLTPDESFNVGQGAYLADAALHHGPLLWTPSVARTVFAEPKHLPDHPPLGRFWIGIVHHLASPFVGHAGDAPLNITAARLASCLALALTVFFMTQWARHQFGPMTAALAAILLILMSVVVGHARIAALETVTTLMWFAALVPLLQTADADTPPGDRRMMIAGVLFGLLLLTKVQGILLPPVVVGWLAFRHRTSAIRPLAIWMLVGVGVFFLGWPWLWTHPVSHTLQYLGRTTERSILFVRYLGHRYPDREVPWHYPFVITAFTLPLPAYIGLLLRPWRRLLPAEQLLLVSSLWPLIVFALPGIPVYDGPRLFLMIMPAIAILASRGLSSPVERLLAAFQRRCASRLAAQVTFALMMSLLLSICCGLPGSRIFSPFAMDQYSLVVGGSRGAQALGMEASYWAEGMNGEFWNQVPAGSTVYVAPVSHQWQLTDLETLVPAIRARNLHLEAFQYDASQQKGLLVLIHRLADLRTSLRSVPPGGRLVAEVRDEGVVLVQLVDTSEATWTVVPE